MPLCKTLLLSFAAKFAAAFCEDGLSSWPSLYDDNGKPSVDVIVAQAPLFSVNPKVGGALGMFGLYHSALVFAQDSLQGSERRYWTLEFDAVAGPVRAALPRVLGNDLIWNETDARFCLTEGLLWGQAHWTKSFDVAARITAADARHTFDDAVLPLNGTGPGTAPFYQMWSVPHGADGLGVEDITCADGVSWVLNHIKSTLSGAVLASPLLNEFHATEVAPLGRLVPVDVSKPEKWASVFEFFNSQVDLIEHWGSLALPEKLFSFRRTFPVKYIYDTNVQLYYELETPIFPFIHSVFEKKHSYLHLGHAMRAAQAVV